MENHKAGVSDINKEIIAHENGRFVLHDSQGFEPGEVKNFQKVITFLQTRKGMVDVRDQVHAIWYGYYPSIISWTRWWRCASGFVSQYRSLQVIGCSKLGLKSYLARRPLENLVLVGFWRSPVNNHSLLSRVPLITVFTKYDRLVKEVQFGNNLNREADVSAKEYKCATNLSEKKPAARVSV